MRILQDIANIFAYLQTKNVPDSPPRNIGENVKNVPTYIAPKMAIYVITANTKGNSGSDYTLLNKMNRSGSEKAIEDRSDRF